MKNVFYVLGMFVLFVVSAGFITKVQHQPHQHKYTKTLPSGMMGQVLSTRSLPSGNLGLEIVSLDNEASSFWVYYDAKSPAMSLFSDCSGEKIQSCKVENLPARAERIRLTRAVPGILVVDASDSSRPNFMRMGRGRDCFSRPSFTKEVTLQDGDVVAFPGGAFVVRNVGPDPFGLQKAKSERRFPRNIEGCRRFEIRVEDLDFDVIPHATIENTNRTSVRARDYLRQTQDSWVALNSLATKACLATFGSALSSVYKLPGRLAPAALVLRGKQCADENADKTGRGGEQ
jgi:hypothetical protein